MAWDRLLDNLDHLTCANGTATFADSELKTFVHCNRSDELNGDFHVIARHNHLYTLGEHDLTGNIEGTDEELRTIVIVERSVTTAFFFLQNIDLSLELGVRSDGLGLGNNFAALYVLLVNTTEEKTYVVTSLALREELAEHLNACYNSVARFIAEADEFHRVIDVDGTGLDTTGNNSTTASDGEDVLDRHEEVLVNKTLGQRNVLVNCVHEVHDYIFPMLVTVQSTKCGTTDDRAVLIELVESEEVANLHFYEVEHFLIVNKVNLVHENEDLRDVNLTGEKDVLASLGHRTIGGCNHEDCAVHLGSTGNHVLHIVGVARAVNVSVVTLFGLILNVSGVDGDTTLFLFGSVVDLVERLYLVSVATNALCEHLGDGSGEGGLTVVNVADSTDVDMRFGSLECFFCHSINIV
jgi:hypothetical protein